MSLAVSRSAVTPGKPRSATLVNQGPANNLAWAAGLFEGEGCIQCPRPANRRKAYPGLSLCMTDEDVVRRFHLTVECGTVRKREPRREGWKAAWVWSTQQAREVERLLMAFLPYLGSRRASKAREALDLCASIDTPMAERTHCVNGHRYSPDNTGHQICGGFRQRFCRTCKRERAHVR